MSSSSLVAGFFLREWRRRLVHGRARGLQAYGNGDGADFEDIPVMQLHFALDRLIVEERAISAVEIVDKCLLTPTKQGAMAFADHRARWPQVALWIAANDESR